MSVYYVILLSTIVLSISAFQNYSFFEKALFRPYLMKQNNEWWRWVSSGFIHKDYTHLIVNMLTFYFFGSYVEKMYDVISNGHGTLMFSLFYLSAIVVSSMFDYHKYQDQYSYSALGASGAVSAVIFSYVLFEPTGKIYLYMVLGIPTWLFGILYLYYEYYLGKKQLDNIGHNAHFFGAVYGLVFPILIHPQSGLDFIHKLMNLFH
jgi:membrane associated rhomboid family serine protease